MGIFDGKIAVVTGAGGTLCSEISVALALEGARVYLVGRTEEKLQKTYDKKIEAVEEIKNRNQLWHEHCEFCMCKITNQMDKACYTTKDEYRWVCIDCFSDFKDRFNWKIQKPK